ncbi:DUF2071 domain-containing protein [Halobellus rarus]|uniref:DUF2071 domain-containing protein n=1 Tax=Halobellus rarus TaxID=1126237 RepID=A0ABD6CPT4_9EURY
MAVLRMRRTDALFAHWPVDPTVVSSRLPAGLAVATDDGQAWLGVVGFAMYFFSLEAHDCVGVARRLFRVPYFRALNTIPTARDFSNSSLNIQRGYYALDWYTSTCTTSESTVKIRGVTPWDS